MLDWKVIFGGARASVGFVGLVFAYQQLAPAPSAYGRVEFGKDDLGQPIRDPKAYIKFGNMGYGPMYIRNMYVEEKGKKCDIKNVFQPDIKASYVVSSVSEKLFQEHKYYHPFQKDAIIPLVTVRPKGDGNDGRFGNDFLEDLEKRQIAIVVEVTASDMFPFKHFTHTRKLYMLSPKE